MADFNVEIDDIPDYELLCLEASAGTGKTYAIEKMVTRLLLADNVDPSEIVVVTFTREAAAELRARIRANLVEELRREERVDATSSAAAFVRLRLSQFGTMRISTIHSFAQRTLALLGDDLSRVSPVANSANFLLGVENDILWSLDDDDVSNLWAGQAKTTWWITQAAKFLGPNPKATIVASKLDIPGRGMAPYVVSVLERIRTAISKRKAAMGIAGFDDLLVRLDERLNVRTDAELVAKSISVLFIDEFQDTDALQWSCFEKLHKASPIRKRVVVGDPKQAIYGFRGGDIQVYREAVHGQRQASLSKNWRSTSTFVEAGNLYFSRLKQENDEIGFGADLSDLELNGIHGGVAPVFYSDVSAAGHLKDASIGRASWEFRKLEFSNPGGPKAPKPTKAVVQEAAARDVVTVIQNLIGNVIPDPECKCNIRHFRRVNYDDIVILIRAHDFGGLIAKVLREADIPVSSLGGQNIFASEAARQWRIFLGALSRPGNAQDVRLFAQSWFGKHTLSDLVMWNHEHLMQTDTASRTLDDMQRRLVNWRSMILSQGASVLGVIVDQTGVRLSLNESSAAERHITDLSQLVEIMSATSAQTPEDLETFMESAKVKGEEIDEDDADVDVSDFSLRVSRDEPAVRVMTYHKSKGLEFPIVLVPHLAASEPNNVPVTTYRLGGSEPKSYIDITAFSKEDDDAAHIGYDSKTRLSNAENLRLGYVALTRGKLMNFVWTWESEKNQPLFYSNPQEIADLAKSSGGIIALTNAHQWSPTSLSEDLLEQGSERESQASGMKVALRRTEVKRELSRPQLRSSFTSVSEYIGRQMVEVLQEEDVEPSVEGVAASTGVSEDFVDLVSSARIGDFIHHILQYLDISPDVDDETITESVRAASVAKGFREGQLPLVDVVTIIKRSLGTTLGPLADSHQLGFFGTGRRLPEVNFDFVLPETQDLRAFVSIIRRHLDSDEVCGRWSQSLQAFKELPRGVLTGSIDAVLAVGDDESPAFLVVDYKSNRLKDASGAESYAMALMESAMREHHYFLQAIIYTVALHRYLSQRMGEGVYDYETHIRGALYLFVRGMSPLVERSGVFEMRFPEKLITDLSEFFDGRSSQ